MRSSILFVALMACGVAHAQQVQGPGGIVASCNGVLTIPGRSVNYRADSVVFGVRLSDWTPETVSFLKGMVDTCTQGKRVRQDVIDRANASIDRLAALPEVQRLADEKKAAEEGRRQRLATCESKPEAATYNAQERVIAGVEAIQGWKQNQAHERRVAQASGVRNLWEERNNGEWIVQLQDELKVDFSEYKRLGGKAASPQAVTHKLPDPCADLR